MIVAAFKDPVKDSKIENGIVSGELPFLDLRIVTGDQILTRHQTTVFSVSVSPYPIRNSHRIMANFDTIMKSLRLPHSHDSVIVSP